MEHHFEPVEGIFDESTLYTRYQVGITFTTLVFGGIPQKPEIIESWLRQRILGGDEELRLMLLKTLDDLDIEVPVDASREEIIEAAKQVAATRNGNTFRRNGKGLCLAAYNAKAMLKEATAIVFPGGMGTGTHKWGATKKAPRSYLAERVFVDDYLIALGRDEPDGVWTQIGHVSGPQGKRATLTYYDYCVQPQVTFAVWSMEDSITPAQWERILLAGEKQGMGAIRSMEHGKFKVTKFEQVSNGHTTDAGASG